MKKRKEKNNIQNEMTTTANIQGVNLPLFATPIKTNPYQIGDINPYVTKKDNLFLRPDVPALKHLKIKDDKKFKRKKSKKRKKFEDRIKDIEHNYIQDMRDNSYLMSYGPGAIGF